MPWSGRIVPLELMHRYLHVLIGCYYVAAPCLLAACTRFACSVRVCSRWTAADVHWLNSLNGGQACLLVDSYRDLRNGEALEEAFHLIEVYSN